MMSATRCRRQRATVDDQTPLHPGGSSGCLKLAESYRTVEDVGGHDRHRVVGRPGQVHDFEGHTHPDDGCPRSGHVVDIYIPAQLERDLDVGVARSRSETSLPTGCPSSRRRTATRSSRKAGRRHQGPAQPVAVQGALTGSKWSPIGAADQRPRRRPRRRDCQQSASNQASQRHRLHRVASLRFAC